MCKTRQLRPFSQGWNPLKAVKASVGKYPISCTYPIFQKRAVACLSSLSGLAVISLAEAAVAQLNVNVHLGGSPQPVYVVPNPPSPPVYVVPTPQTQPVYVLQPTVVGVPPTSPRSRHHRKKPHRHQSQYVIPANPNGVLITF